MKYHDDDPADCNDHLTLDDMLTTMFETNEPEFPQDDYDFRDIDPESLQYKDEVVMKLIDALQEYLSFSTVRDLMRLIVDNQL